MSQLCLTEELKVFGIIALFLCLFFFEFSDSNHNNTETNDYKPNDTAALIGDWCSVTCTVFQLTNIVCERGANCDIPMECSLEFIDRPSLVEAHNELRNFFASGREKYAGYVGASNMFALSWDDDLEFAAKCNLALCKSEYDKCRNTPSFPDHVGQNIWTNTFNNRSIDCNEEALGAIPYWYAEIRQTQAQRILSDTISYQKNDPTQRFTQLVWADTSHVGCAISRADTRDKQSGEYQTTTCSMTCNYGPGGNVYANHMFLMGNPCTNCSKGARCDDRDNHTALCHLDTRSDDKPSVAPESRSNVKLTLACFIPLVMYILML